MRHERFPVNPAEVERLLFHWPRVVRLSENDWAKDFAKSIAMQSRRHGWTPTPKQFGIMRRMVADLFAHTSTEEIDLIE